ncbi:hypothetical protein DV706_13300 [Natronorubrum bangense]|uniref:Uncharacterized protein n=2 Tax=Natronorubrum bangense TaxID=61858 RepID=L9WK01_9EURY|nr:hypothetical protein C494_06895 [Natronorubrum bangense JCM 10635]QCC55354.1 hypothetical protein DV706_13300 [Natronorubrum bangense]
MPSWISGKIVLLLTINMGLRNHSREKHLTVIPYTNRSHRMLMWSTKTDILPKMDHHSLTSRLSDHISSYVMGRVQQQADTDGTRDDNITRNTSICEEWLSIGSCLIRMATRRLLCCRFVYLRFLMADL